MIPKINELNEIAAFFIEKYKAENLSNVSVVFLVNAREMKKVNEELFYRGGGQGTPPEISDEIIVNGPDGLQFRFEEKEAPEE